MRNSASEQQAVAMSPPRTDPSNNSDKRPVLVLDDIQEDTKLLVPVVAVHSHTVPKTAGQGTCRTDLGDALTGQLLPSAGSALRSL